MSFTPTNIANLILWLDAADTSTISFSSGSNVSQWNDKSSIQNNMTQSTTSIQPIFGAMANGLNSLNFSGSKWLQNAVMNFPNAPYTVFAIGYGNGTSYGRLLNAVTDSYFFLGADTTGNLYSSFVGAPSNGHWTNGTDANSPNYNCRTLCMMEFTNNGSTGGLIPYFNGSVQTAKNGITASFTGLSVGKGHNSTEQYWNGYVSEVIIYSSILTTTQRQQIEGYLAWKWDLRASLPTNHPYYRTILQNSAFSPSSIGNIILWLDAADSSTISYSSGSNVSQWNDKSSIQNNMTQSTTSAQPIFGDMANGLNSLNLTGNRSLENALMNFPNAPYTVFAIGYGGGSAYGRLLDGLNDSYFFLGFLNSIYTTFVSNGTGNWINGIDANSPNYNCSNLCMMEFTNNGTTGGLIPYFNGNAQNAKNGSTVAFTGLRIGKNTTNQPWNGYVSEILIYSSILTNTQRQQVEGYLAWKWGVRSGLPTSHLYYKTILPNSYFSPSNIGNLILWLDATDSSTIITSNGVNVTSWNDKSGQSNNFTTAVGTPKITTKTINNLNAMDLTSTCFFKRDTFPLVSNYTIFIVGYTNTTSGESYMLGGYSNCIMFFGGVNGNFNTSNGDGIGNSNWNNLSANTPNRLITSTNGYVLSMVSDYTNNNGIFPYHNGTAQDKKNITYIPKVTSGLYIGGTIAGAVYSNSVIGEIIYYNGVLTNTQRQQVEGYLAWKWGLQTSLATNHPFYSTPLLLSSSISKINSNIVVSPIINTFYGNAIFNIGASTNNTETPIVYTSGNTFIATVNSFGNVTIGNIGNTTISMVQVDTTNYTGITANTIINVSKAITNITANASFNVSYKSASFNIGASTNNGETSIVYTSGNTFIATVNSFGNVTVGNAGSATISMVQANTTNYVGTTANTIVNVSNAITTITANATFNAVYKSASFNIGASTNNTETPIVYTSGNTYIATVDQSGNVIVGNTGSATISMVQANTSNYTGITANTIINVSKAITNITANASFNTAYKSASFNIGASTNNTETPIVYTSGNTYIATVDQSGNVIAGNIGNTTISMVQANTTNYIGITANTIVNVSKAITIITANASFNVDYKSASFNIGASANNTETSIVYTSGNTYIATVDETGNVIVGNAGSVNISMVQENTTNYIGTTANTIINVSKIVPIITADASFNVAYKSALFNIGASTTNTETSIVYTSGNTYIATVDQSGNVIVGNVGSAIISMTQSETTNYLEITANTTVSIARIQPSITVTSSFIKTMGDPSFNLGATSTNTDTSIIQYTSTNPNVANVVADVVTIGNSGITTITSFQPQTANYFAVSANTTVNVASVSYQPSFAFDNSLNPASSSEWRSVVSTYNATTGAYTGSQSTTYDTSFNASGEWLQVKINSAIVAKYYQLSWFIDSSTNSCTIPKSWVLLGSSNSTTWSFIDSFNYNLNTAPTNTSAQPALIQLRNIYTNNLNVQWFRLIVTSIFPGGSLSYTRISEIDFFAENANTLNINRWMKPIVTRTHVLHPTTIIPFSANMGSQTVYMLTDLDCNLIGNNRINNGYYNTNIIKGAGNRIITSTCFDGQNLMTTPMTGNICYINNDGMNTNLNFDISLNGSLFQKNITGNIYASCFNGQRIIMGGTGTNVITYISPLQNSPDATFKPALNANHLMTSVFGLASNSGYGHVYIPNRIYMNPGDKISVIAPKSYNQHLSDTNTISMNLNNATITKNI